MSVIFTNHCLYQLAPYENEAELEEVILKVRDDLFGQNRIYLDIKKRIGIRGIQENIPDGYLIDLSNKTPKLYFVENELANHDVLRHIAVQILGFSLAFESEPRKVRNILFDAIEKSAEVKGKCNEYITKHNYRNLDHLLDQLVFHNQFSALIIIDELPVKLGNLLIQKLAFNVDVLQLARYKNNDNDYIYQFEPFLQDIAVDVKGGTIITNVDPSSVDTIVVPAREEGFNEVFINEKRWYEIRMESSMRQKIKYIAAYQVAPIHAITYIAEIKSIEPYGNNGKWVVNFAAPAQTINHVILAKEGRVKAPQGPRYTTKEDLLLARTLDDIW